MDCLKSCQLLLPMSSFKRVITSFRTLDQFERTEIDGEDLSNIYQTLWIFGVNTLQKLKELVSSQNIMDALKQVYREELLRPEDNLFAPIEFATSGCFLLTQLTTPSSIDELRRILRGMQEYQKKHPGTGVPPMVAVNLDRIHSGKQYIDLFSNAHLLISDYDQPSDETEAEIIRDLLQTSEDLDVEENFIFPRIALEIDREIQELQRCGYHVYGASKDGQYRVGNIVLDTRGVYIVISRKDISPFIALSQSDFRPNET